MKTYNFNVDIIKAFSIISVLIIHTFDLQTKSSMFYAYHILQAVPLFLLVSASLYATGTLNKKIDLSMEYNRSVLFKKLKRILMPYIPIIIFQVIVLSIMRKKQSILSIVLSVLSGGWGPGGYYIPLMIQVIFLLPVLRIMVEKYNSKVLYLTFVFNMLYELLAYYDIVYSEIYRLLVFRYVFLLVLGIFFVKNHVKATRFWIVLAVSSCIYITAIEYFNLPSFANIGWRSQNIYAFFYPFLLFVFVMNSRIKTSRLVESVIKNIAQASFHIYLVQMVYFWIAPTVLRGVNICIYLVISILITVLVGWMFYKIDRYLKLY